MVTMSSDIWLTWQPRAHFLCFVFRHISYITNIVSQLGFHFEPLALTDTSTRMSHFFHMHHGSLGIYPLWWHRIYSFKMLFRLESATWTRKSIWCRRIWPSDNSTSWSASEFRSDPKTPSSSSWTTWTPRRRPPWALFINSITRRTSSSTSPTRTSPSTAESSNRRFRTPTTSIIK